ncbi:MAG TPA: hypothetical protein VJC16_06835 [Candidatus Nanoarchaeia archaeon]|nr:hypothetical protein [Candidatus Nanoarchaeia archaeon]
MRYLTALLFLCVLAPPLRAQWTLDVPYRSEYLWRGFLLQPERRAAIQPTLTYTSRTGLWLTLFGSASPEERPETDYADEADLVLGYTRKGERLTWTASTIRYLFVRNLPLSTPDFQEVQASITGNVFLSPTMLLSGLVQSQHGFYAGMGISQPVQLPKKALMAFAASAGFNHHIFIPTSGISDIDLSGSIEAPGPGKTSIYANLHYAIVPMEGVNEHYQLWWTLGFRLAF